MSKRTHSKGQVGRMRVFVLSLASVFAAALVFAVACAAQQTQNADGTRASEKKAAAEASGDKSEVRAEASKVAL